MSIISGIRPTDPTKRELRLRPDPFDKGAFLNNFNYFSEISNSSDNLVEFVQDYVFGVSEKNPEVINWIDEIANEASNDNNRRLLALGSLCNDKMLRSKNVYLVIPVLAKYINDPLLKAKLENTNEENNLRNVIDRLDDVADTAISRLCDGLVFAKDDSERTKLESNFLETYIKSCGQGRALANLARVAIGHSRHEQFYAMQLIKKIDPSLGFDALIGILKISNSVPTTEEYKEMFSGLIKSLSKK